MSTPYLAYGSPRPQVVPKPYMYPPNNPSSTYSLNDSSTTIPGKYEFAPEPSRTPSPTPSEAAELARATFIDWKALTNWRFWLRREWICAYSLPTHFPAHGQLSLRVLSHRYHPCHDKRTRHHIPSSNRSTAHPRNPVDEKVSPLSDCCDFPGLTNLSLFFFSSFLSLLLLSPFTSVPGGWSIPIGILFIISFPPVRHASEE